MQPVKRAAAIRTKRFSHLHFADDRAIMSLPEPAPEVARLRAYQIESAKRLDSSLLRDAHLTLLNDEGRWKWLTKMNEMSLKSNPRRQVFPGGPAPASIDVAA